jgi:hypothetical protein
MLLTLQLHWPHIFPSSAPHLLVSVPALTFSFCSFFVGLLVAASSFGSLQFIFVILGFSHVTTFCCSFNRRSCTFSVNLPLRLRVNFHALHALYVLPGLRVHFTHFVVLRQKFQASFCLRMKINVPRDLEEKFQELFLAELKFSYLSPPPWSRSET